MTSFEDRIARKPVRTILFAGIAFIGVIGALAGVTSLVNMAINPIVQAGRVVNKTIDADNVLGNYEWFKRQAADYGAFDAKIATAQAAVDSFVAAAGPRTAWTFEDKQESARLNSVLQGLKSQKAGIAAEYNARSQMLNRSIFKSNDLPESLN